MAARIPGDRAEGGWVLTDVLIGAVVITVGLVGTTLVLDQSQQSSARVSQHAEAVELATSLLSQATAYACGAETGLSLPAGVPTDSDYPSTASLWSRCAGVYSGNAATAYPGALGDPVETDVLAVGPPAAWSVTVGGNRFAVSYRATWVAAATGGACPDLSSRGGVGPMPIGQTRTVTVHWLDHGASVNFTASTFSGTPVDDAEYSSPDSGGILVTGMAPGSMARLEVPVSIMVPAAAGTVAVDRAASGGGGAGCAWFPFLPPAPAGTYAVQYYADGDPSGPVTAKAPNTLTVRSGSVATWTP
jgi:hypothetical protein